MKSNKKILVLADFLHPEVVGGSARFASDLNDSMVDAGHKIIVITREPSGDYFVIKHDFMNYEVVRWGSIKRIYKLIRSSDWDYIISHHYLLGLLTWLSSNKVPKKYFFQGPSYQEHIARKGGWSGSAIRYLLESLVLLRQHDVFTLSEYMRNKLPEWVKPKSSIVGPLHRKLLKNLPARKSLNDRPLKLLTVRRLTPRTGVKELIELCSLLEDRVHLTVVGKGGLLDELKQSCPGNVTLAGYVDDSSLGDYYESADLFILPSIDLEGFGLVILESLYSGTPVMASSTSGGGAEYLSEISDRFIYNRDISADGFYEKCLDAVSEFNRVEIRENLILKLNLTSMDEFSRML